MLRPLLQAIKQLSTGKRLVVLMAALLIILTWLAVCAILGSYLVP